MNCPYKRPYKRPYRSKLAVLAGTHRQFIQYCHDHGLRPNHDAVYACDGYVLCGMRFRAYVRVGTWEDLPKDVVCDFSQHQLIYGQGRTSTEGDAMSETQRAAIDLYESQYGKIPPELLGVNEALMRTLDAYTTALTQAEQRGMERAAGILDRLAHGKEPIRVDTLNDGAKAIRAAKEAR